MLGNDLYNGLYDKVIYVAGKFQNDPKRKEYIENCCRQFYKQYNGDDDRRWLFVNGVSQFSYLYNDTDFQEGIDMCLWLLKQCDMVWVVGDFADSMGTNCEIVAAKMLGIPVRVVGE